MLIQSSLSIHTYRAMAGAMFASKPLSVYRVPQQQQQRRGVSGARSSLDPPDLTRLAQTARISLTPAEVSSQLSPFAVNLVYFLGFEFWIVYV